VTHKVLPITYALPWSVTSKEESRFRLLLIAALVIALIISFVIPSIEVPKVERHEAEKVPPRLAKMLLEKKKIEPPPPPPKPEPEKPKVEEKKPEPKPEPKPEQKPKPKPVEQPKPKPKKDVEAARKKAASVGVLAMKDMLADLREAPAVEAVKKTKDLQTGGTEERVMSRSVLVAKASKGSGGIDTSKFSRNSGNTQLASRSATEVTSEIDAIQEAETVREEPTRGRSLDEISRIMNANYAAVFTVYQRALRKNPLLQGKVVFKMTIDPSGTVTDCKVLESELGDPHLERKLALRIKSINFGAKQVETTTIDFPIDFLPTG